MSKKLFGLAPLLAIVGFMAVAASSQAAIIPHWYKSGVRLVSKGKHTPVITWGGATNLKQESVAGEINCKAVGAGYVENPEPGGAAGPAGVGATESSNFYECKEPKCETEVKEALGALGYKGVGFAVAYNFPWTNQLLGSAEPFEEKIGAKPNAGVGQSWGGTYGGEPIAEGFPARQQAPGGHGGSQNGSVNAEKEQGAVSRWGAPGAIGAIVGCEIFPNPEGAPALGGVTGQPERVSSPLAAKPGEIAFEGELHPKIGGVLNEAPSAGSPAVTSFEGKPSGELEDFVGPGAGGYNTGKIKYLGYEAQSPIDVNEKGAEN